MVENGFVLLTNNTFDSQQLINDLQNRWQIVPESFESRDSAFSFSIDGFFCSLSVMPAPIPNEEAQRFAHGNYYCRDAVDIAKAHKAHLMVIVTDLSVDTSNDTVNITGMTLYSKIIASSLHQDNAIGVYTSGTVFNPEFYIKTCEKYLCNSGHINIPIMIWVFIGLAQTETGNQLFTIGMEKFDKAEMEILNSKENMQSLLTMFIGVCSHIINTNMIMKHGETFGFSAEQKWTISHSVSVFARSEYSLKLKVNNLDFDNSNTATFNTHNKTEQTNAVQENTDHSLNQEKENTQQSNAHNSNVHNSNTQKDTVNNQSIANNQKILELQNFNEQSVPSKPDLHKNDPESSENKSSENKELVNKGQANTPKHTNKTPTQNTRNKPSTNGYITFFALVSFFLTISTVVFGYLYFANQKEPQFTTIDELQEYSDNIGEESTQGGLDENTATQKPTDIKSRGLPASYFLAGIKEKHPDTVALYGGTYEPKDRNGNQAIIDVPYTDRPVVLYLSSYHKVSWKLNYIANVEYPDKKTNVVGVVYSSYEEGTTVDGVSSDRVFESTQSLGDYKAFKNNGSTHCAGGHFHYEGSDVIQDIAKLQKNYGIKVLDFAGEYAVTRLSFQNINNPINFTEMAKKNYKEIEALRKKCTARTNPNYETMYQDGESQDTTSRTSDIIFHDDTSSYPIETNPNRDNLEFDKHLYKFPLTTTTWGDYLNPQHNVPHTGFMAYYINSDSPKIIVNKRQTSDIQQKYIYDEFLGIPSQNFNAYWVGVLKAPKSEFYNVLMNKSWSGGRVSIDRRVILEKGKHNVKDKVFIPKGNHIVEVEYSNNWHTTDVQVVIEPLSSVKQPTDPTNFLAKIKSQHPNVVALFAGAYEAKNKAIALDIPKSTVPVVLYLGSYESINWQINNPNNTNIAGVVFGSYTAGTKVQGISDDKVINIGKQFGNYKTKGACKPTGSSPFKKYDIPIVEYVGKYSTDYLAFKAVNGKCS